MSNSLTVLLPVKNAQSTLSATVQELLEVVAEMSEQFEILIVDDGSQDATSEVAQELKRSYPQIRTISAGSSLGRDEAIQAGLRNSQNDSVIIREENGGHSLAEIAKMWRSNARMSQQFHKAPNLGAMQNKTPIICREGGYRLIDRRTAQMSSVASRPARPNYLARLKQLAFGE